MAAAAGKTPLCGAKMIALCVGVFHHPPSSLEPPQPPFALPPHLTGSHQSVGECHTEYSVSQQKISGMMAGADGQATKGGVDMGDVEGGVLGKSDRSRVW